MAREKLDLEHAEPKLPRPAAVEPPHQFQHQVELGPEGSLLLCGSRQQLRGPSEAVEQIDIGAQVGERLRQHNFAKRVKFGAAAAAEAELRQVKQVELAPKRRLGPARALGHGADTAGPGAEPMNDEAGFRQRKNTQDQAGGALIHRPAFSPPVT